MALSPDPKRRNKAYKKAPGRPLKDSTESMVLAGEMLKSGQLARNGGAQFSPTDDVISRYGYSTYREMRHDDQVKVCLEFKKILVGGRTWQVKPYDDSDKAKQIAEFVEHNLKRINLRQVIKEMLSAFEFGFCVSEILWETGDYEGETAILLKALKPRDPTSIEITMDKHGNVQKFSQVDIGINAEIAPEKAWHFAYNGRFGNPYGESDLRSAYRSWWAKKFVINFWNVFLERMGAPMTMMKYPQGASQDLKNTLKGILSGLSSKSELLVPEGVEVELIEATRGGQATYSEALTFHNNSIARAILMVAILGAGGDDVRNAADSQSQIHLRATFKIADEITQNLSYSLHCQVIKQLVDMNFEHDGLYPEIVWQDYGQFEGVKVADTIRLLHAAGIIDMDQTDVNYARSVLGLPLRGEDDKEDEVVRPQPLPPPADPNKPPPKAGQGNEIAKKGGDGGPNSTKKASEDTDGVVEMKDDNDFVRAFFSEFADMKKEIADLKQRDPNQITINPTVNVAAPTQAAAAAPNVTVNVPEQPVNVNVTTPEVKVDVAAPNVHVDGTTVNVASKGNVTKTFEYDGAGNIISSTETEK